MSAFCGLCGGILKLLGILGRKEWVRCESCGIDYSREIEVLK